MSESCSSYSRRCSEDAGALAAGEEAAPAEEVKEVMAEEKREMA